MSELMHRIDDRNVPAHYKFGSACGCKVGNLKIICSPTQEYQANYEDTLAASFDTVPPHAVLQVQCPRCTDLAVVLRLRLWLDPLGGLRHAKPRAHTRTEFSTATWSGRHCRPELRQKLGQPRRPLLACDGYAKRAKRAVQMCARFFNRAVFLVL